MACRYGVRPAGWRQGPLVWRVRTAAEKLLEMGAMAALIKGAHVAGDVIVDVLATHTGEHFFAGPRIATKATHGTGCTLASGIAAGLARGLVLTDAVAQSTVDLAVQALAAHPAVAGPVVALRVEMLEG